MNPFTIVIPTRDDPERCTQLLTALAEENVTVRLPLRVVFLVNDTGASGTRRLEHAVSNEKFVSLQPRLLYATRNLLTVEENIRHTLGANLDAVDEHFLIVGNSDRVNVATLRGAIEYLESNRLDLLLIALVNQEVYDNKPIRQLYSNPRHINPKNRLGPDSCFGPNVFSDVMADCGPVDYLAYIGCQIYTKAFFRELCGVLDELPEPLYSLPVATLELTSRKNWAVGFYPFVTVIRIDHLQYGPNSAAQPPDWWVFRSRTARGLSRHIFLSVISNSLHLCDAAFKTLVNSHIIAIPRACPQYLYSNFLFSFVQQTTNVVAAVDKDITLRFTPDELRDIVSFGRRLASVDIGLPPEQRALLATWLQHFGVIGDYSNRTTIQELLSGTSAALSLLEMRPGMERWVAQAL